MAYFVDKMMNFATAAEPQISKATAFTFESRCDDGLRLGTTQMLAY